MKGRPPKPKVLKTLEGNRGKREIPDEVPADGCPAKPADLCPVASAHWDHVVEHVVGWGIAKAIDANALEQLCRYWALWKALLPRAVADPADPEIKNALTKYSTEWQKLASKFGMSPVDRAKLAITEAKKKDDFEDEFLKVTG